MSTFDDLPVAGEPDPVESDDPTVLRTEILRLRDGLLGANGRAEVLRDRVDELERREARLAEENAELHTALGQHPLIRLARAVRRRLSTQP